MSQKTPYFAPSCEEFAVIPEGVIAQSKADTSGLVPTIDSFNEEKEWN